MEDVYDSQQSLTKYNSNDNVVLLSWKEGVSGENYRTASMLAADLLGQHEDSILIIDRTVDFETSSADMKWTEKTFLPALSKSRCKRCFIIVPEAKLNTVDFPYNLIAQILKTDKATSYEDALSKIVKKIVPSAEVLAMTQEQAYKFIGFDEPCDRDTLDDKYWKLSKRYRTEENADQKLADLTAAYEIATGEAQKRKEILEARALEKKYFKKTKGEWKLWFSYTWYWFIIIPVVIAVCCSLLYTMFIRDDYDVTIVGVGHFALSTEINESFLTDSLGYSNPYLNTVDVVYSNEEYQTNGTYSELAASAVFSSIPNVVITDRSTVDYYYDNLMDLTEFYELCEQKLPGEVFDNITPIYCTQVDSYAAIMNYQISIGMTYEEPTQELSTEPIIIGIEITNPEYLEAMGYDSYWEDPEEGIVFSIYSDTQDMDISENVILNYLGALSNYL